MKNFALAKRLHNAVAAWYASDKTKAELGDKLNLVANCHAALEAAGGFEIEHPITTLSLDFVFSANDYVRKKGGDYTFEGFVVAAFRKTSGQVRYVVEDDRGVLHVYSAGNLELVPSHSTPGSGTIAEPNFHPSELQLRTKSG